MGELTGWVLTFNVATFCAVIGFGYRVVRFVNFIEFRVGLLWEDYEQRRDSPGHVHYRRQDRERER